MSDRVHLRARSEAARKILGGEEADLPANHPFARRLRDTGQADEGHGLSEEARRRRDESAKPAEKAPKLRPMGGT